jgi:hypothetical protein
LSVVVMAHPERGELARRLSRTLGGARVVWDRYGDRWDTGRRAMLAFEEESDWHLVVQDDAILCLGFLDQVRKALEHGGDGPVAFYMGRTGRMEGVSPMEAVAKARTLGRPWIEGPGPRWGVAVAVRPRDIPAMVEHGDRLDLENYDLRMADYFSSVGRRCRYSVPSLVDHRVGPSNPSLVPGRVNVAGRTAQWFQKGGRNEPWTGEVVRIGGSERQMFSVAVMTHPDRVGYLEHLYDRLPPFYQVTDRGGGVWETAIEAWQAMDREARWHVVVQDDALVCDGFGERLGEVLEGARDQAVSLYLGREKWHVRVQAREAWESGADFLELERLYWGVGIALPTAMVPRMLEWATSPERSFPDGWKGKRCDTRVSRWCMDQGIPVRYPLPSLLDHRAGPSLLGGYMEEPDERVAWWFQDGPKPWGLR